MKIDLSTKTIKKQIIRIQHFIYLLKFIYDMKKTIIFLFSISALNLAYAQSDSKLQKKFAKERIENQSKLDKIIKKANKTNALFYEQNRNSLAGFALDFPLFWKTEDVPANTSANLIPLKNGTLSGINNTIIDGTAINIHIFDEGLVHSTQNEFNNTGSSRAINKEESSTYIGGSQNGQLVTKSSHSTNVTGIIIAAGVNGSINFGSTISPAGTSEGVLKNANTSNFSFRETNLGTNYHKLANTYDINISNHSYGVNVGWILVKNSDGSNKELRWYGNYSMNNLDTFSGSYLSNDQNFDAIVYSNPNQIVVKSAGNYFGTGPGMYPSLPKYKLDISTGNYVLFEANEVLPEDNCSQGYNCIGTGSLAKNIIVVGATQQLNTSGSLYTSSGDVNKASYSSAGPRKDGAIKPDISAVGSSIVSPTYDSNNPTSNNRYTKGNGTSYAAPIIAGIAGAITQVNRIITGDNTFTYKADEMKALLTHTANEAGNLGPDVWYGWGFADATKAAQLVIDKKDKKAYFERNLLNSGVKFTKTITAKAGEPLKATISWVDPAATPFNTYEDIQNNHSSMIVNDLDVRIIDTTDNTIYYPWKLDINDPMANATKGDNLVDNIEQVLIETPVAGRTYRIEVSNKGKLVNDSGSFAPQNYALIITGFDSSASLQTSENSKEKLVTVYPTKTKDVVNILIPKGGKSIEIFDFTGKSVLKINAKGFQTVDVSKLPKGVYLVNIKTEKGTTTQKIIKE